MEWNNIFCNVPGQNHDLFKIGKKDANHGIYTEFDLEEGRTKPVPVQSEIWDSHPWEHAVKNGVEKLAG